MVSEYSFRMAAGPQAQGWDQPSRRRGARYRVQAPVDVTVLRSGIPDSVPGRSVNLGAGGVAAVMAAELLPGEVVGVEILLPQAGDALRARARVRHHDKLRCGMEFVGLSAAQQADIRDWVENATEETQPEADSGMRAKLPVQAATDAAKQEKKASKGRRSGGGRPPTRWQFGRGWMFFLVSAAILLAVLWWRWNRGWEDLESRQRKTEATMQPQAHVPADVMEKLVTHRVDPDYPAAARRNKLQGVIVLDVIVGRDGSVLDLHALNGPEILAQSATDAMRWWRFKPYRVDGQPVVVETTVAMEFKP
jgi:TonB family protein